MSKDWASGNPAFTMLGLAAWSPARSDFSNHAIVPFSLSGSGQVAL